MIGIYKITNKINGKVYIGFSNDIQVRWNQHKYSSTHAEGTKQDTVLYRAMRKYGIENFSFEVIETFPTYNRQQLSSREIYWIKYYNSYKDGYNSTVGGDGHSTAILSEEDIIDIRTRYLSCKERGIEIYQDYKDKISQIQFLKVVSWNCWTYIMPNALTPEIKQWHIHYDQDRVGEANGNHKLTKEDVIKLRLARKNNESPSIYYENNLKDKVTWRTFRAAWYYETWKSVIM